MPYIEMVRDGLYSISFNGKSFCIDERCIHRIYRSGWISFDRETHTFRSGFEYPALGSIIEDIVRTNYFSNN